MIYFSRHTKHVLTRRSWRTEWVDSSRGEKKRREKWDPGACFSLFACVSWSIYSWLLKFSTDSNPFWAHRHRIVQSTHFVTITLATLCFNCPGNSLRSLIRMRDEADGSRWWCSACIYRIEIWDDFSRLAPFAAYFAVMMMLQKSKAHRAC